MAVPAAATSVVAAAVAPATSAPPHASAAAQPAASAIPTIATASASATIQYLAAAVKEELLARATTNEAALRALAAEDVKQCGWKAVSDGSGVSIWRKPVIDGSGGFCFRGVGVVPASPQQTLALLWDLDRKGEYDSFFAGHRIVCDLDADTQINVQTSISIPFVSPREFLYLARKSIGEISVSVGGGTGAAAGLITQTVPQCVLSAQTIDCDQLCPPSKGVVRGTVKASGFVIEGVPNQPNVSKLTFVCDMRLNGSLPSFVTSKVLADTPLCIAKLRPILAAITAAAASPSGAAAAAAGNGPTTTAFGTGK